MTSLAQGAQVIGDTVRFSFLIQSECHSLHPLRAWLGTPSLLLSSEEASKDHSSMGFLSFYSECVSRLPRDKHPLSVDWRKWFKKKKKRVDFLVGRWIRIHLPT